MERLEELYEAKKVLKSEADVLNEKIESLYDKDIDIAIALSEITTEIGEIEQYLQDLDTEEK